MKRATPATKSSKQTVSLTLNTELCAAAKALKINMSHVAEHALAQEIARRQAELHAAEIERDLEAMNAYVDKHGSFADLARAHYGDDE